MDDYVRIVIELQVNDDTVKYERQLRGEWLDGITFATALGQAFRATRDFIPNSPHTTALFPEICSDGDRVAACGGLAFIADADEQIDAKHFEEAWEIVCRILGRR